MQETQETRLQSLDQEDPVEKGMTVFLPGEMKVEGAYYYQCGYKTWLPTWLSQTPPVVGEGLGYLMTVWPEVTNHILVAHSVKNPANVGHLGSIPGLGRSPGKGNGRRPTGKKTYSSLLAWKVLCTEKPGGLSPWGHKSWTQLSN